MAQTFINKIYKIISWWQSITFIKLTLANFFTSLGKTGNDKCQCNCPYNGNMVKMCSPFTECLTLINIQWKDLELSWEENCLYMQTSRSDFKREVILLWWAGYLHLSIGCEFMHVWMWVYVFVGLPFCSTSAWAIGKKGKEKKRYKKQNVDQWYKNKEITIIDLYNSFSSSQPDDSAMMLFMCNLQ